VLNIRVSFIFDFKHTVSYGACKHYVQTFVFLK